MDRGLHRAHGQSEHRNGACEGPMTLKWDDTNQQGTHVVEFSVQLCTRHWTAPRCERHADAWAETDSPNGRLLKGCDRVARFRTSGRKLGKLLAAGGRICGGSSVSRIETDFHRPRSFISYPVRAPRAASMEDPLCRARGWMRFSKTLSHRSFFVPHCQGVVIVEVGAALCGFSMAEGCCSQGQALATSTTQLDRVVGRMSFGLQWSVSWVETHPVTCADSLHRNLDVSSLDGQGFSFF